MRGMGGVDSAAIARSTPFSTRPYDNAPIAVDGFVAQADEQPTSDYNAVSPGYFGTMGIRLISGRDFTRADEDTTTPVAIVSQTMATTYWPGVSPIGRRLQAKGRWMQVVGVARDTKYSSLLKPARPLFYVPLRQSASTTVSLFLKTARPPNTVAPQLIREIHALDPNLSPYEVLTMREQVDRSTSPQQVAVALLTMFGSLALFLAAIGLYGVMSYSVSQSTREFGLRTALGAAPRSLLQLVLSRGLVLTAVGILVGIVASLSSTRLMGDLLFGVSPHDPKSFAAALILMVLCSFAACIVPAWRAARTDPVVALRES
jgi:predicted permease